MSFEKINILRSPMVATNVENIDTDQIIPARYLKATTREGFGDAMFHDWRFTPSGEVIGDSIFAKGPKDAKILVAGRNFGCGSSREHAAWAIVDYGFRAVVSSFFADIFKNNALNNGLLPVQISEDFLQEILKIYREHMKAGNAERVQLEINLPEREITLIEVLPAGEKRIGSERFPIGEYKKHCLENGLEDIDYLLTTKPLIEKYESQKR